MSGLQQKYWVFHEITVRVFCMKHEAIEFFEDAHSLDTHAKVFDLKK
jgi:hypothetical protein